MGRSFEVNSKAEEGRARKAAAKEAQKEKERTKKAEHENKKWQEGTKDTSKKEVEEAKRLEKLIKKQERKVLEDQECKEFVKAKVPTNIKLSISSASSVKDNDGSLSHSGSFNWSVSSQSEISALDTPEYSASNIDDALILLESSNQLAASVSVEKHPERRMKAAFALFEMQEMPKLRAEFPTLRHSQLLERLYKLWQKSPDNPFNQLHVTHNITPEERNRIVQENMDKNLERMRLK